MSFPLNGEEATGNEWETMRAGFKLGSPAHKHYCATRQSTFTNHWALSLTFCIIFYRKCILVPVTMSLRAHLWQTAQVMVSLAAPVSLWNCTCHKNVKAHRHLVPRNNVRNVTGAVQEEMNLDLKAGTFSADVFFSRWFECVWFQSCTSLTNIHRLKPRIVAISNKVIVLFNCQKHCIWCLVSTIYYRYT